MWPFSRWTTAGRAALTYITIGALTVIWAGVWYVYMFNNSGTESAYYWCTGFLLTGLAMVFIGLGVGLFSRSTRHADVSPAGVPVAVANLQPNTATAPALVTSPVVAPNRQVVFAPPEELSPG
ncbi:MAG: hypothetical protein L0Y72_15535 [Gemmataceae bacterium]|nr:hypothetical protein [Gemmataceae bacterium]MCI0740458.1 hypothetical protein [Gemmataceae bacterium]